jgi:DNA-binding beta-propeller fold protein YncE
MSFWRQLHLMGLALLVGVPAARAAEIPEGTAVAGFRVTHTLKVGRAPHGIRFSPDGQKALVVLAGEGKVAVVDLGPMKVLTKLPAGKAPLDLVALNQPGQWAVSQFATGTSLIGMSETQQPALGPWPVGKGPSLFTPDTVQGKTYITSEFADELTLFDTRTAQVIGRFPTGKNPYPADVTPDGVLAFVPCRGDGTVTVIDLLNQKTAASVPTGQKLEGGALTRDGVSYLAASSATNEVVYVNTAAYEVTARVAEGVGPRPFSVAMTLDGRYGLINNAGSDTLSVLDVAGRRILGRLKVGKQPIVVRMHPDGGRVLVANEVSDSLNVIELPPAVPATAPNPARPNEVIVVGTIHGEHRSSKRYSLDVLRSLVRAIRPDFVLAEISPNRFDKAHEQFLAGQPITEPRVRVFPEYVDVMFPLSKEMGFQIVPTAGWNQPMHTFRNEALKRLAQDPARAAEWKAYQEAQAKSEAAVKAGGGPDDPRYLHSDAYDAALEIELKVYSTFDKDLGPGGWETINAAHYANIARALDAHRGEGKRFLITYGAGHKGWFLRQLRQRSDIKLLAVTSFLK